MAKGLKYLLLMLLILGCDYSNTTVIKSADDDDVHFSCFLVKCLNPSIGYTSTTGYDLETCYKDEEQMQEIRAITIHHSGSTNDAVDRCYLIYRIGENSPYGYADSCFCEAGIVF